MSKYALTTRYYWAGVCVDRTERHLQLFKNIWKLQKKEEKRQESLGCRDTECSVCVGVEAPIQFPNTAAHKLLTDEKGLSFKQISPHLS